MAYALWVKCVAEVVGIAFAIWLGQSTVANELLAHTKGHGMGFGWLSLGYALAFGIGVLLTGWISAYFNPALALAAWINGNGITSPSEYFAISFSTICGAFLGGLMVFLQFWPHFQVVPRRPGGIKTCSGRFLQDDASSDDDTASEHDPMEQPVYNDNTGGSYSDLSTSEGEDCHVRGLFTQQSVRVRVSPAASTHPDPVEGGKRPLPRDLSVRSCPGAKAAAAEDRPGETQQVRVHRHDTPAARGAQFGGQGTSPDSNLPKLLRSFRPLLDAIRRARKATEANMDNTRLANTVQLDARGGGAAEVEAKVFERMEKGCDAAERAMAAKYARAIKADQVAKLLCFCTRPAIYSPALNWLCEFISTIALIVPIFVFQAQLSRVHPNTTVQYNIISALFVAGLIILLVVGAGGPTGVAMNPARDMGPRLAHWMLPIRGKGSSELLSYSWVPLTASLTAAVPAAFIVRGVNHLISTGVPSPATATVGSG